MKWRIIPSLDGTYEASDSGLIRRSRDLRYRHSLRLLKARKTWWGYVSVSIKHNGKQFNRSVHSLVAEAFIGKRPWYSTVNHKDGDKLNNCPSNLEYI
jgi:hypothetical protein